MTGSVKQAGIISDANVLIDYAKSAPNVLRLISKYVRKLYVPLPVLREVDQLNKSDIAKLGTEIIEPTLAQLIEAGQIRQNKRSVSGKDAICFVMARDNNWACLTNDKPLRRICSAHKISCIWGLEIMLSLVSDEKLPAEKAYKIAQDIQSKNHYIKLKTVEDLRKKLGL